MKNYLFCALAAWFAVSGSAFADSDAVAALRTERDALENQLKGLRSENARCNKQKSVWTAATVIGGLGVVGTTAGAIYQGVDWSKENKKLEQKKQELEKVNTNINSIKSN
ncbi:MAG: hypothetical protein LBT45_02675 [Rickettsiales bacterium]|jgi:hypothetical protein|nr:hypothetical protein [Rickettsiales bacterium]